MRKFLAAFWLAFILSPVAGAFAPGPDCLLCQATEHAYCGGQGHDCAAHAPKEEAACECDGGAEAKKPEPAPSAPRESLGHKCTQGDAAWFFAEGPRYEPLTSQKLEAPSVQRPAAPLADFFRMNPTQDPQDRPPSLA